MNKDWTIDTYVLYRAADVDYDAISFLQKILNERSEIAFDYEGNIEKEYRDCFIKAQRERKGGSVALKEWFKQIVSKRARKFISGTLDTKKQKDLADLRFDRSDWPFVAVCSKTASKRLVSEDSDYNEQVKNYLKSEMSIDVLPIKDALKS